MKVMLASDWDEAKVTFPCDAQPKIDGVRGLNMLGALTGRSLKKHANKHTTKFFSHSALLGLDGELAAESDTHPDLCRLTTSALNRIEGEPYIVWWLFDYVTPATKMLPYEQRRLKLIDRLQVLWADLSLRHIATRLRLVPSYRCNNMEELIAADNHFLELGYEGTIIRSPSKAHKEGRSTVKEGGLLRIKRFIDAEAVVVGIVEGETNGNEAQRNELGLQFRSSHQENMIPNGQIGSMLCRLLKDVVDPQNPDKVLLTKGQEITVSPGKMPVKDREYYFAHQDEILQHVIKFKFFPKGVKDKPRFPTFQSFRAASDMGGEA